MTLPVREPLLALVDKLEHALEAKFTGREDQWIASVERGLGGVATGLTEHSAELETNDGLFSSLADPQHNALLPGKRRIRRLRQEHSDFTWWIQGLQKNIKNLRNRLLVPTQTKVGQIHRLRGTNGAEEKFREFRHRARYLVARLKHHRDSEAQLLLESVTTEIGGGD